MFGPGESCQSNIGGAYRQAEFVRKKNKSGLDLETICSGESTWPSPCRQALPYRRALIF